MEGRTLSRLAQMWKARPTRVPSQEGYARWAPLYPAHPHNPVMEAEASRLGPMVAAASPRRALDVGTGTGRNLHLLHAAGARLVVGVDLSRDMLAHGTHAFPTVCGDGVRLPFGPAMFDVVCSSLMCGDVEDLGAWVREACRVVTRGGHVIYSDFHPSWAAAGWRRRFEAQDGRTYELPLFPHKIEEHVDLLEGQGLEIRAVHEPCLPGGVTPVVVVVHAVKSAHRNR